MATKGIPIDFSKKYRMADGTKITKIEPRDSLHYPVTACHIEDGIQYCYTYTFDGFLNCDDQPDKCDLVLDEEAPVKKRKVVQIAVKNESDQSFAMIIALTDDGNIYGAQIISDAPREWIKLAEIPQD
jgi:hypothetical protein